MRVLVLTTDCSHARPSPTEQIGAAFERGNVSYSLVHPRQLLKELAVGSQVALLVVDGIGLAPWLPEVFGELRRRVLGPSRPALVVVGDGPISVHVLRLFTSGVCNWLSTSQAARLVDYWHWVCCQCNADLGGQDASRRLSVLHEQCASRHGYLEMVDRRLHARMTVSDGRLSFPEILEFDSEFTRVVRQFVAVRLFSSVVRVRRTNEEQRGALIQGGQWDEVLVRDAVENQLQDVLRWFLGTTAHTRFVESAVSVPPGSCWRAEDLVDDGPRSRYRFAKGFLRHQQSLVANDTALADVS